MTVPPPEARSRRRRRPRAVAVGAPPGTLVPSDPHAPRPVLHVLAYGPEGFVERVPGSVAEVAPLLREWPVVWLNVDGLGDPSVIAAVGELFGLHPLALEDVVHVHQRPKSEEYDGTAFIVARMARWEDGRLDTEQVSLFLGRNFVVTFQERPGDVFAPVRERIRTGGSRLRGSGPDYLAYALLDAVVDQYFLVLEGVGERLEALEDRVVSAPDREGLARIHELKRELLHLRRAVWPLRDALGALVRGELAVVGPETRVYLRDAYDHAIRVLDLLESDRETVASLMEVYLSSVSNRMNEIMKVLTIIATVFIPLSFVAGIYGMNFNPDVSPWNMPELNWRYGYPFALGLMLAIGLGLLAYCWRKGWFRSWH